MSHVRAPELIRPSGKALVFAPHPDDEVFGCGGVLALHRQQGDDVRVIIMTDGCMANGNFSDKEQGLTRRKESEKGCAVLGVSDCVFWDYPDRGLILDDTLVARMTREIAAFSPDIIYVPSPQEQNPDHKTAAHAVWLAVRELSDACASRLSIRLTECAFPLPANVAVDISGVEPVKLAAIQCHASQLSGLHYEQTITSLNAYRATFFDQIEAAEAFAQFQKSDTQFPLHDMVLHAAGCEEHSEPALAFSMLATMKSLPAPHVYRDEAAFVETCVSIQCRGQQALLGRSEAAHNCLLHMQEVIKIHRIRKTERLYRLAEFCKRLVPLRVRQWISRLRFS